MFINQLYGGFDNNTEVMAVIGYKVEVDEMGNSHNHVGMVKYYTSNETHTVTGNFKGIVQDMAHYMYIKGEGVGFLVLHNHPAGTVEASVSDTVFAERMGVACRLMGADFGGSYIYIDQSQYVTVMSGDVDLVGERVVNANLFPMQEGVVTMPVMTARRHFDEAKRRQEEFALYDEPLNEGAIMDYLHQNRLAEFALVELSGDNRVLAIYELDELNLANVETELFADSHLSKGLSYVFLKDAPRFLVYDRREVERDELGLAEDTKVFIQAMGVCGYPVTFYAN